MPTKLQTSFANLISHARLLPSMLAGAALAGTLALAGLAAAPRAHADSGLCAVGSQCRPGLRPALEKHRAYRFEMALQRDEDADGALRRPELSEQDYSTFSGIGVIVCSAGGETRSSTAFLVGAFDLGVTVAHTFESRRGTAIPAGDCVYNSMDSLGQVRERIPISYVKSQWEAEAGAFGEPSKDLAVVRLSHPSRYAQRTMPLGRFSGDAVSVVMVGFRSDSGTGTFKRKAQGTVYERNGDGGATPSLAGFTHDMDARGIAAGAPVIDARTGVIIGIHNRLPASHNAMITMNDWLEATLRREMQSEAQSRANQEEKRTADGG